MSFWGIMSFSCNCSLALLLLQFMRIYQVMSKQILKGSWSNRFPWKFSMWAYAMYNMHVLLIWSKK